VVVVLVIGLLVSLHVVASATRGKDGRARPEGTPQRREAENLNRYRELLSIQELACVLITSPSPGCSSSEPRAADTPSDTLRTHAAREAEGLQQGKIRHDSTSGELNFDYVCLLFDYPSV
jgi:hypothetical protein